MGILKLLGFDKSIEIPKQGNKFVQVFIEFSGFKDSKKSEIVKIANDISSILYNTQSVFNKNNECVGCINPHLGINTINTNAGGDIEGYEIRTLSKPFKPTFEKQKNGETKITFYPMKNKKEIDLYSLPRFHQDGFGIFNACKWIAERYSIDGGEFGLKHDKADLTKGQPTIEKIEGLLHMKYLVSQRIENAKIMPELDKLVFTNDVDETISNLLKDSKKTNLSENQKEWKEKVEKLIEK